MAVGNHSSVPEGFKEIPGYDGRYFINQRGLVWSVLRNRLLTQHLDSQQMYLTVLIGREKGAKPRPKAVHRLMGLTWMGNPPGKIGKKKGCYCINHKDGNKLNNMLVNLEWVTHAENTKHAWRNGLNAQVGETNKRSALSSSQARAIRLRLITGEPAYKIAIEYGLGKNCVEKLRMYANWKHQDHDLVEPMMRISNSITLRKMYDALQSNEITSSAYSAVAQSIPDCVAAELKNSTKINNSMALIGWTYCI